MKKVFLQYTGGFFSLSIICLAVLFLKGDQAFKTYAVVMLACTAVFAIAAILCYEMENAALRQQQDSDKNNQVYQHPQCGCNRSA